MSAAPPTHSSAEELFRPGTHLGDGHRYSIQSVIAIGGMAAVYRAWDERLGDECAIKAFCADNFADDPTAEQEFHEEALLLAKLRHPGVVAVRDHFFHGLHAFLVMDFVPGDNLYDRHRRFARPDEDSDDVPLNPIPETQVAAYGIQLAETLAYLHAQSPPVIYRDLKPHNVICRVTDRRLILLDFGIARLFKPAPHACDTQAMGTPGYAAPEQYDDQLQSDPRTDIYNLGVVLFELATGYNPRAEGGSRKLPHPREARPTLSPALTTILTRCTAWERDSRYQTAQALIEDLGAIVSGTGQKHVRQPERKEPAWRFGTEAPIMAQPSLSHGTLFLADCRGGAYAVEMANGQRRWQYRVPCENKAPDERVTVARTAMALSPGDSLLALSYPCGEGMLGATLADARTGTHRTIIKAPLARHVLPLIVVPGDPSHNSSPALVVALGSPNEAVSISLGTRSIRWRVPLAYPPNSLTLVSPEAGEQNILIGDSFGYLRALRIADGQPVWQRQICHGPLIAPPLVRGESVIAGGAPGDPTLACLSIKTGLARWQTALAGQSVGAPIVSAGVLIVPTRNAGLFGLEPSTGALLWRRTEYTRPLVGACAIGDTDLFALAEYGEGARLIIVRASGQGETIWEAALPAGGSMVAPVSGAKQIVALGVNGTVCGWDLGGLA